MKNKNAIFFFFPLCILLCCIFILVAAKTRKTSLQRAEPGFTIETVLENLSVPWEIVFLPDNSMLFTKRPGRVRLYRKGKLLPTPLLQLMDIDSTKKMGLLGLTLHPAFNSNGYLYLAYNYKSNDRSWLRVVRYTLQKDTLVQPKTIIEDIPANQNHTGCCLKFGSDNKLYITTGDADEAAKSQNKNTFNGKILRLNEDGSIPADNPFVHVPEAHAEVWSYGHRNPQGLAFQPRTNKIYISEHGPNGGDEINIITKGANYGWPVIHHQQTKDSMTSPLLEFTPSIGPAAAIFYNSNVLPQFKDHLLVACLRGEAILDIQLNDTGGVAKHEFLIQKQLGRIRAMAVGPDGYLYLSTSQKDPPEGKPSGGDDKIVRLVPSNVPAASKPVVEQRVIKSEAKKIAANSAQSNTPQKLFQDLCMNCHGSQLKGSQSAKLISKTSWKHGGSLDKVVLSITKGYPGKGMPAWEEAIPQQDIKKLAAYFIKMADKNKK
jgi:glucose/arabinose dehydrogenase